MLMPMLALLLSLSGGRPAAPQSDSQIEMTNPKAAVVRPHAVLPMAFPQEISNLSRNDVHSYNEDSTDVSVTYINPDLKATIYIYPAPKRPNGTPDLNRALSAIRQEIESLSPKARKPVITTDIIVQNGTPAKGFKMVYHLTGQFSPNEKPKSLIYQTRLFARGSWLIHYRFTYFAASKAASEASIQKLCNALPWPTKP